MGKFSSRISVTGPAQPLIWTHRIFYEGKSGWVRFRELSQPGWPDSYEKALTMWQVGVKRSNGGMGFSRPRNMFWKQISRLCFSEKNFLFFSWATSFMAMHLQLPLALLPFDPFPCWTPFPCILRPQYERQSKLSRLITVRTDGDDRIIAFFFAVNKNKGSGWPLLVVD